MADERAMPLQGPWDAGFVLAYHSVSSVFLGHDEYGHAQYDTTRSQIGEWLYQLKYRSDRSGMQPLANAAAAFYKEWGIVADFVVPVPPSKHRNFQPLLAIANEFATLIGVPICEECVRKTAATPELKNIYDHSERIKALQDKFEAMPDLVAGKQILLLDDLFRSGATMTVLTDALREAGASRIYALALTRTKSS